MSGALQRRALSTACYALFHGLAETAADRLVGVTPQARRSPAWSRVYRDLDHNHAKKACFRVENSNVSSDLLLFTTTFPDLQELRHLADYDPNVRFQHNFVVTRIVVTLALGMTRS